MSGLPMPTRGPVRVVTAVKPQHQDGIGDCAIVADGAVIIAETYRRVAETRFEPARPNADLVAAAFNAATEAADMGLGFDPIGAIQALPMLISACIEAGANASSAVRCRYGFTGSVGEAEAVENDSTVRACSSALAAARTRKES